MTIEPGSAMYSTPFDAPFRNRFAFDLSFVRRRAIDLSSGNIATVRPAKPTARMTSRPLKSGVPGAVSPRTTVDWAEAKSRGNATAINVTISRESLDLLIDVLNYRCEV